jgi:hypothetical protein
MVAGVGVVLVGRYVLDELFGPERLTRDATELAGGVALAIIWAPVWVWHRQRVLRFAEEEPAERRSVLRKLTLYLTLGVTAGLGTQAAVELVRWIDGSRDFGGYPVAGVLVWWGVWAYHWLAEQREGQPTDETRTVRRLYLYSISAYSLAMLAAGVAVVLYLIFRDAYEGLFDVPRLLSGDEGLSGDQMRNGIALAIVGGAVWSYHWLVVARDDTASDLRQFYLFVFVILGGAITTLTATGVLTFGVLQWLFGTPDEDAASMHFRFLAGTIATVIVAVALWLYHWETARRERAAYGRLAEVTRLNGYVMSALGLGALAGAIAVLAPTMIGIVISSAREVLAGDDWWRDRMTLAATLGVIGAPVWAYFWFSMQGRLAAGGVDERGSLPRRLFIYGVLTAGALAALGSVSHLLFLILDRALGEGLSLTMLRDGKWSIGALVTALLIAPYYWFVLQEDRQALAEAAPVPRAAPRRKSVAVLIPEGGGALVRQIEAQIKQSVRVLDRLDVGAKLPELSAEELERLDQRVTAAPGERVLLVVDAGGVQVYSYR